MKKVYCLNQDEIDIIESCLNEIKYKLNKCERNYFISCALDAVNELRNILILEEQFNDNN